jgi:hypothetical protein
MLRVENADPSLLGYDRPSPKLLGFLRKHYGLSEYDPQSNNFVVFKTYFRAAPPRPGAATAAARDLLVSQRPLSGSRGRRGWPAPDPPAPAREPDSQWAPARRRGDQPPSALQAPAGRPDLSSAPAGLQAGYAAGGGGVRARWGDTAPAGAKENDSLSAFASLHAAGGGGGGGGGGAYGLGAEGGRRDPCVERQERGMGALNIQDEATGVFLHARAASRHQSVTERGRRVRERERGRE